MSVGILVRAERPAECTTRDAFKRSVVETAIRSLAHYGYAATTPAAVAEMAGLEKSAQLPFASRQAMMVAVWEHLADCRDAYYEASGDRHLPLDKRLDCMITAAIERAGNPENLAVLELKMATRGDAKLRNALLQKINDRETEIDDHWVDLFGDTGMPRQDLVAARYMIVAMCRGLSIEKINQTSPSILIRMETDIRQTAHALIYDRSRSVVPN